MGRSYLVAGRSQAKSVRGPAARGYARRYRQLHELCEVLVAFDCFIIPPKVRFRVDRNLVHC